MENPADKIVAALQDDWPDWHVWYIPRAIGGLIWCARRQDDGRHVLTWTELQRLRELGEELKRDPLELALKELATYKRDLREARLSRDEYKRRLLRCETTEDHRMAANEDPARTRLSRSAPAAAK